MYLYIVCIYEKLIIHFYIFLDDFYCRQMQITGDTEFIGQCKEKQTKQYINIVLAKLFK